MVELVLEVELVEVVLVVAGGVAAAGVGVRLLAPEPGAAATEETVGAGLGGTTGLAGAGAGAGVGAGAGFAVATGFGVAVFFSVTCCATLWTGRAGAGATWCARATGRTLPAASSVMTAPTSSRGCSCSSDRFGAFAAARPVLPDFGAVFDVAIFVFTVTLVSIRAVVPFAKKAGQGVASLKERMKFLTAAVRPCG